MKKNWIVNVLKFAFVLAMAFSMVACSSDEETVGPVPLEPFAGTVLFEVTWNGTFNPAYSSTGVSIEDPAGTVLWTSEGAMSQNNGNPDLHTMQATGGFFPSDTALNFATAGAAWNGVFAKSTIATLDMSTASKAFIAVKGMPAGIAYMELQLASGATVSKNFLNYTAFDGGDGWTVYAVPLSVYTGVDSTAIMQVGVWNPNLVNSDIDTERNTPTTNFPAIAPDTMLVSVAFGN